MGMDGDQRLLQEVFRLRRTVTDSREAVPVVSAQVGGELLQKLVIRFRIAIQAGCHKSSKLAFVRMSEFVHLQTAGSVEPYAIAGEPLRLLRSKARWMRPLPCFSLRFPAVDWKELCPLLRGRYRRLRIACANPKVVFNGSDFPDLRVAIAGTGPYLACASYWSVRRSLTIGYILFFRIDR
jgi:hypothetical protein